MNSIEKGLSVGFIGSIVLTFVSYWIAVSEFFNEWILYAFLSLLALLQIAIQLSYFLHLKDEQPPRFKLTSFLFMALVTAIVIIGSIWIIYHLNNRTMPPM